MKLKENLLLEKAKALDKLTREQQLGKDELDMLEAKIAEAQRSQVDALDTSNMVPSSAGEDAQQEASVVDPEKEEAA